MAYQVDAFQVDAFQVTTPNAYGQTQAIITNKTPTGQVQAQIKQTYIQIGQSQASIKNTYYGLGQAVALITDYYVLDIFSRTTPYGGTDGNLGKPDVGPNLTPMYGDVNEIIKARVVNGEFKHLYNTNFDDTWVEYLIDKADIDYRGEFRYDEVGTTAYVEFDARRIHVSEFVWVTNVWTSFVTTSSWRLHTTTGNTDTALPFTLQVGTKYAFHLQVEDVNARVNIWVAGESEPVGWLIERTGATAGQSGSVGFYASASSNGSKTYIDNISVLPAYTAARLQTKISQAQALIHVPYVNAQAQALIDKPLRHAQASAFIYPGFEMEMGQAQSTITPQYLIFLDTFTREIEPTKSNKLSLGPPDVGIYQYFQSSEESYSLGTRLETVTGFNDGEIYIQPFIPGSDAITITFDFYTSTYSLFAIDGYYQIEASNGGFFQGVYLRLETEDDPANDTFRMEFYDTSTLSVPFNVVNGETYRMRLSIGGTTFQGKIWNVNNPEPDWMLVATQTAFTVSWISIDAYAGSVAADVINAVDNISVYSTTYPVTQKYGQARAKILQNIYHGLACARILATSTRSGQARPFIRFNAGRGQAIARIKLVQYRVGQSNALIFNPTVKQYAQAQASITPQYIHFLDTFSRVIVSTTSGANTLGDPDFGKYYAFSADSPGVSSSGTILDLPINNNSVDALFYTVIGSNTATISWDINSSEFNGFETYLLQAVNIDQSDGFYLQVSAFGGAVLRLGSILGGSTQIAFSRTSGSTYRVVLLITPTTIKAKAWEIGTQEPDWQLSFSGTSLLINGVQWELNSGVFSSYPGLITLDNLSIYSPDPYAGLQRYGQAQAAIESSIKNSYGQANAGIIKTVRAFGLARARLGSRWVFGQVRAHIILVDLTKSGQALAFITSRTPQAQAQATITTTKPAAQSHAWVETTYGNYGQARANVELIVRKQGQAQAQIFGYPFKHGLSRAYIYRPQGYGQSQAFILRFIVAQIGQAQTLIKSRIIKSGQVRSLIVPHSQLYGQAQAQLISSPKRLAQARAFISVPKGIGQAQAFIFRVIVSKMGQAQGLIGYIYSPTGSARAVIIKPTSVGQAQAKMLSFGRPLIGLSRAFIRRTDTYTTSGQAGAQVRRYDPVGQSQALITGGRYFVKYNGYQLPGYAQSESFDSITRVHVSDPDYIDGPFTEYFGLDNKLISLRMLVVGNTYLDVKNQVQKAATIVRSSRGWAKLYIQTYDRYYTVITKKIGTDKSVNESMRLLNYNVEFEAKPWLTGDVLHTLTGTGIINTDQVSRTYDSGGWSTANVILSGTNATVSGYTESGEYAGFISTIGTVSNENYTIRVGPGKTIFDINGATSCTITYNDKWYL